MKASMGNGLKEEVESVAKFSNSPINRDLNGDHTIATGWKEDHLLVKAFGGAD